MKLSVPIYSLKRLAKNILRKENFPLHVATGEVAKTEGFENWSLLAARAKASFSATDMMGLLTKTRTSKRRHIDDVRLPNPVDLALFDRACFLYDGRVGHAQL